MYSEYILTITNEKIKNKKQKQTKKGRIEANSRAPDRKYYKKI
jgi:hypothetical protein